MAQVAQMIKLRNLAVILPFDSICHPFSATNEMQYKDDKIRLTPFLTHFTG
jgi:hypothetical protein